MRLPRWWNRKLGCLKNLLTKLTQNGYNCHGWSYETSSGFRQETHTHIHENIFHERSLRCKKNASDIRLQSVRGNKTHRTVALRFVFMFFLPYGAFLKLWYPKVSPKHPAFFIGCSIVDHPAGVATFLETPQTLVPRVPGGAWPRLASRLLVSSTLRPSSSGVQVFGTEDGISRDFSGSGSDAMVKFCKLVDSKLENWPKIS